MKNHIIIILLACCLVPLPGCESYLDVNKCVTTQNNVEAVEYLPGILAAYESMYYDIRALGPLTQMLGTNIYYNFAKNYYYRESDSGSEIWRMVYLSQGMNLENMIGQAEKEGKWTLAGIGYAIKAFSWDALTKYHGEAPMKQAFDPGRTAFEYDYQPEIMAQCRKWAETAITCLEKEDATDYGERLSSADLVYHGNKEKWIKFAHSVIVSDLAALTNKKDFATEYAPELLEHAEFAIDSNDDNFAVECAGCNNVWGTAGGYLRYDYWETEYITLLLTGSVVKYDETNGNRVRTQNHDDYYVFLWELAVPQIICDTSKATGHYDPRAIAKLCTRQGKYYDKMSDADAIKDFRYYGSNFTESTGPTGYSASNLYGVNNSSMNLSTDGTGRWLFRDDAPYILLTASEIQFELAETYWKLGRKSDALTAFRKGVELDLEFSGRYLNPGSPKEDERGNKVAGGGLPGGSQITHETYNALASEYLNGPYVKGLSEDKLTLSHIMMQKYVALWPWGALEAWTDLRKYHFDLDYSGEYPVLGDGFDLDGLNQKWDSDPTKVFKGFYLAPAKVEYRRSQYNTDNAGSPCYRVRPRYSSEYKWNKAALAAIRPIPGDAPDYHCSIPWFAYPGDYPEVF